MKDVTKRGQRKAGRAAVLAVKVIEVLVGTAFNFLDFAGAAMEAGYGASGSRIEYLYSKNKTAGLSDFSAEDRKNLISARHKKLLYRLRRDKLIAEVKNPGGIKSYIVTAKGKLYAKFLRKRYENKLINRNYVKEPSDEFIVVAFDISEKERAKRNWLRSALKRIGFIKIQQSLWIGQVKIPKDFLEDIKKYNLVDQVEFFKAVKLGSLSDER